MPLHSRSYLTALRAQARWLVASPAALALFPALVLGGFWLGGEEMLIMIALGFPVCLTFAGGLSSSDSAAHPDNDDPQMTGQRGFEAAMDSAARSAAQSSRRTGCILLALDDYPDVLDRYGKATIDAMMTRQLERLQSALRSRDTVCRLEDNLFAVCVAPVRQLDLGNALHMASRLQSALEEPLVIDATTAYVSASVGLTLDTNVTSKTGTGLFDAAMIALAEARRHGPSAMRAYSHEMHAPIILCETTLADEAREALDAGQIQPWYQPQLSTDTGLISGFEALARWDHPDRGLISPAEFLPALQQANQMERLGEVMLFAALGALKSWDAAGLDVPHVGVNFAPEELRNPRLAEKIEWELDRFDLPANRLSVEILETVMATSPDDTVVRNIAGLSRLGCQIDLDDFGTGHASISSIRRFDVQRLKIDRSFVMKVDLDSQQRRMVSAILLMAEQLGLDTLAEGVETAGEHAMLAQLGCGHVQGFGISRPLPFDQTVTWANTYLSKLQALPRIGRQTG
ncbi:bifunctional diguanylate cyclase/phosphodiesterase [Rhodobacteraceae bacterium KMM 6894]|nr:bifunctional diguanylate cyclase/phosphodiesterase [Rhodobacteraceae bacterium KMM 6894]